jgi:hypothetical protein
MSTRISSMSRPRGQLAKCRSGASRRPENRRLARGRSPVRPPRRPPPTADDGAQRRPRRSPRRRTCVVGARRIHSRGSGNERTTAYPNWAASALTTLDSDQDTAVLTERRQSPLRSLVVGLAAAVFATHGSSRHECHSVLPQREATAHLPGAGRGAQTRPQPRRSPSRHAQDKSYCVKERFALWKSSIRLGPVFI